MQSSPITIFTPSFADEDNANAQNLTVKEIVSRLPAELFRVIMIRSGAPDARIAHRPNTQLIRWSHHGNSFRLAKEILTTKPDIYFFPRYGPLDRAFVGMRRYLHLRTALITYVVMAISEGNVSKEVCQSIQQANRVFGNSEHVARTVTRHFGIDCETMYDGVDRRFFFPRQQTAADDSRAPLVLYAGSFQMRKRVDLIIHDAARLPGVEFRLAGQGETEASCRDLAERLGCRNVVFLGHLSSAQLGGQMRAADIFLFPSILEGNPQVLLQAAACGLPAVAMSCYHPDYVINGKTGFLAATDGELSEALDLLLTNSSLRCTMSQAAVRHAAKFDWDSIAAKWAEVFQQVTGRAETFSRERTA